MKIQNIYHLLQAALLMLLAASCTQEEFPAAQDKAQQLTISVTDGGYASAEDKTTRAVENGYTTKRPKAMPAVSSWCAAHIRIRR